jgi:hypothetical protein
LKLLIKSVFYGVNFQINKGNCLRLSDKFETVDNNGTVTGLVGQYWYDGDGKRIRKYAQLCVCENRISALSKY